MNRKNLLSPHRQTALQRRRAIRRWIVINGVYLGLLTVAGVAYAFATVGQERPALPPADLSSLNTTLAGLRQQTAQQTTNLRSVQEVTQRPDWSVLLAVVAGTLGNDVALDSIDAPATADPANPLAEPKRLRINAVARSQAAVTQFVLRLESLRLFSRVQIEKTAIQPLRGSDGVRFQLNCGLAEETAK